MKNFTDLPFKILLIETEKSKKTCHLYKRLQWKEESPAKGLII